MAHETKNRQHAIGTFVGAEPIAPPFTSRIVNASGVDNFTRNSAGNYTAQLHEPVAFADATVRADLPANFLGIVGAQLAPDGGSVLVTSFDLAGAPTDAPLVAMEVVSVVQGEGADGPAPALPTPPTPPASGGGSLIGWAHLVVNGFMNDQSAENAFTGGANPVTGQYDFSLSPGFPVVRSATGNTDGPVARQASALLFVFPAPGFVSVFFRDDAGNPVDGDCWCWVYA